MLSPIAGNLVKTAIPYAPFCRPSGTGGYAGYRVTLFYVEARECGPVRAGEPIGHAQDLNIKYPGITNHVHVQIEYNRKLVSPIDTYWMCF